MVTGRASGNPGHAKNSWLTGTASWTFLSISQYILGIRPDYDGLIVEPCVPAQWKDFTIRRKFRGAMYVIHVRRTGEKSLCVNGRSLPGNLIPLQAQGSMVQVELTI